VDVRRKPPDMAGISQPLLGNGASIPIHLESHDVCILIYARDHA
jgi:hypothetical protein